MEQDGIKTTIHEHGKPSEQVAIDNLHRLLVSLKDEGNTVEDVTATIERLQAVYKETGLFMSLPSAVLLPKSEAAFNANINRIRTELSNNGVSGETVEAVTQDYGKAITGDYLYRATPVQMLEVLKKVKPYKAYLIDKYGLYYGVLQQYSRCLAMVGKFNDAFRVKGATADTKTVFMDAQYSAFEAVALSYLWDRRYFTLQDFDGIEREQVITWLDGVESWGNVGKYIMYYIIAKLALGASTDELKTIVPPPYFKTAEIAQEYAETHSAHVENKINELYAKVVELIEADTEQEKEQAKQEVEAWESKTNNAAPVVIGHNSAIILSRDIYTSPDAKARDILPITAHIEDYMKLHGFDKMISPYIVEKAVMGINLLQRDKKVKPENGCYTFYTSISEFANISYGWDANEEQKKELLHALKILHNLYIVVWKPTGRHAIQLVSLKDIGLSGEDKGKLTIEVTAQAMTGEEKPISAADFKKLQQAGKGQAQHHFVGQVLSKGNKGHKREDELLDDIFGYTFRINEARMHNATDADIRLIRRNITANKSNHRKQLKKMFDKAQADGLITYKTRTGKDGGTVYEWVSIMHTKEAADDSQAPDEQ